MSDDRLAPEQVRDRRFTRVVRGYRRRDVHRLLARAATDLARLRDGPEPHGDQEEQAPLSAEDIEGARFPPALGGYQMGEVDDFLDEVGAELDRRRREPTRPAAALPPPPPAPITPADVQVRTFTRGMPGYLCEEVDRFLSRAAQELARREHSVQGVLPAPPGAEPGPAFGPNLPDHLQPPADHEPAEAPLTRWDVLRQRFPLGPRGYAMPEVDAFLVQLAAQFPEPGPAFEQEILRRLRPD